MLPLASLLPGTASPILVSPSLDKCSLDAVHKWLLPSLLPVIVCFCSLKGGAGKTTLATHLAAAISQLERRVLLVDADPQASASDWAAARNEAHKPPFSVIGLARDTLHRDLPDIARGFDHVVIDTPPRIAAIARSAILAADLILIPVQPSSYDVWAASETIEVVKEATVFKPELKAALVINRRVTNTAIGRDVEAALDAFPFPVLPKKIAQRVAFAESSSGYSVLESAPSSTSSSTARSPSPGTKPARKPPHSP